MKEMKVLVIGAGGREHALTWALSRSELVGQVFVAPGNAGTAVIAQNIPIADNDLDGLRQFAIEQAIDLTVVGPEVPLSMGIVDQFQAQGLKIFGPTQAAAQLEASKAFAKDFMAEMGIPTANYQTFTDYETAVTALHQFPMPNGIVVKASGLAAGKGVIVCDTLAQAESALKEIMLDKAFGASGDQVILEERLVGSEVSLLAFSDGTTAVAMLPARDHKRAYDNDEGPNTGGMGVYAPPPDVDQNLVAEIMETVINPTVKGMAERGTPYVGVLYAGIMLTPDGPKVLEFNCRFGDPETQVILPMISSDLVELLLRCIDGRLSPDLVKVKPGACATVIMASPGYPASYPKGLPITGIEEANALDDVIVFHAGTKWIGEQLVTSGGRVLAVSARGDGLATAVARAYEGVGHIYFDGAHYRTDIGR